MYRPLDIATWNRQAHFELFRQYEHPFFNLTAPVDVTRLHEFCQDSSLSFFLAGLFCSLKAANEVENLRYRLRGEQAIVWDKLDAGSTVLHDDNTFGFCYFKYEEEVKTFCQKGVERIAAQKASGKLDPKEHADDMVHYSVIPWVSFTGFQHARRHSISDSIPKIVFGKYYQQNSKKLMPVSVELHHALCDGYHAGRYFERFQRLLQEL